MEAPVVKLLESYHLLSYDILDSTNEEAKRLASNGATHGAVVWSREQTNGKGRMGRDWVSPEGNLYVSMLLQPQCDPKELTQLAFVTAVAATDTVGPMVGEECEVRCKWPNDVLLDGKKLGGILLESFSTTNDFGRTQPWVVVGMGLNITAHPEGKLRYPATSLKEAGIELISAKIVLSRFIYNFIMRYDHWQHEGFKDIRKAWCDSAYGIGTSVEVEVAEEVFKGHFEGIDETGRLMLTNDSKKPIAISAGDVRFPDL